MPHSHYHTLSSVNHLIGSDTIINGFKFRKFKSSRAMKPVRVYFCHVGLFVDYILVSLMLLQFLLEYLIKVQNMYAFQGQQLL